MSSQPRQIQAKEKRPEKRNTHTAQYKTNKQTNKLTCAWGVDDTGVATLTPRGRPVHADHCNNTKTRRINALRFFETFSVKLLKYHMG